MFMKKVLCVIFSIIILAFLGVMLIMDRQQKNRQAEHIEQLKKEARSYEKEIEQIRLEIEERRKEVAASSEVSSAIIGFVPTSVVDIEMVKEIKAELQFTPLIVLDCALEEYMLQGIAQAAMIEGYDLIFSGMTFDAGVLEKADNIRNFMNENGYNKESAFFLEQGCDTPENREQLKQHGYKNMVRYSESFDSGIDDSGDPFISYDFIRDSKADVNYIKKVVSAHSYIVMTFNFSDIYNGVVEQTDIAVFLGAVEKSVASNTMKYMDLAGAFNAVVEKDRVAKENEEYEIAQQQRIEELEKMISEIYSRWDEY